MSGVLGFFQEVNWKQPSTLLLPRLPTDWGQLVEELELGSHRSEWSHKGGLPQGLLVYKLASKSSKVVGSLFVRRIELFSKTPGSIKALLNRIAQLAPEHVIGECITLTPKIGTLAFKHISNVLFDLNLIKHLSEDSITVKIKQLNVCDSVQQTQKIHELSMIGTDYFDYIIKGIKPFEGRVNSDKCRAMKIGDLLTLFDHDAGWGIICEITALDTYDCFMDMLKEKGPLNMLPQLHEQQSKGYSYKALLIAGEKIYLSFPKASRVELHGAVAIGVKHLRKVNKSLK